MSVGTTSLHFSITGNAKGLFGKQTQKNLLLDLPSGLALAKGLSQNRIRRRPEMASVCPYSANIMDQTQCEHV